MDSSNRMALIEVDPPTSTPAPAPISKPVGFQLPAPAKAVTMAVAATATTPPPAQPPMGWDNTSIDEEGAERAKAADALATKAGLRFDEPTLFAWGTRMISYGKEAHAQARAELHAQPLLSTLADDAGKLIASEQRRGDVVELAKITYGTDDRLRTKPGAGIPAGVQGLKQLLVRAGAPGGGYLADKRITGELRAPHVAHWITLSKEADTAALEEAKKENARRTTEARTKGETPKLVKEPDPSRIKLLSKLDGNGERSLYGAVGPKYPHTYGMDQVIRDVMGKLPGDVRGSLFYDAATTQWRVDAALGTEFTPVVGDVHRVGIKFGSHDAGGGSYWASLYAIRVRCVNFTQIKAGKKLGRVRHVGSVKALQERLMSLVEVGAEAIRGYSELWAEANQTAIIADTDAQGGDARKVFEALIEAGHLPSIDGREASVERYFNAWLQEPGANRSDYVNAATRAAHEAPWSNPWAADEIEQAASEMLYQHVIISPQQWEAVAGAQ